ncbi:hypothetical protein [Radiobacillus sp. PE A8.2]|uniref:hypothetical protein n=1 Tax=Radiobacillus sp. PE A8.2 TaxID=3380349 RepID=UPI003890BDD8
MAKQRAWVPMLASVGIGAAAYYSMTKGKSMGKTAAQFAPFISSMGQQANQANEASDTNEFQPPIYS